MSGRSNPGAPEPVAAREAILARIAAALSDVPADARPDDVRPPDDAGSPDDARPHGDEPLPLEPDPALVARFAERVADYRAEVVRVAPAHVAATVAAACAARGLTRLAIAPGVPAAWRPGGADDGAGGGAARGAGAAGSCGSPELIEDGALTAAELDVVGAALTGCAAAIAETGTILLDGSPRCGRRLLTLVPDHHLCIVEAGQIVAGVAHGLAAVATAAVAERRPITLISGPSATSDIELQRVEGVHGPRDLLVVIVDPTVGSDSPHDRDR